MWEFTFFRYAIIIAVVLSCLFSLVSFLIVTRKLSFLAIGTEHAAFGGMGIAHFMGWNPFLTTVMFCTLLTVIAGQTHKKSTDSGMSIFFSGAMALGMLLLTFSKSAFNLTGFLFGDLIGVTQIDLIMSIVITSIVFVVLCPALGKIMYLSFDRDSATISGINVTLWDTLVYITLSISIILGIKLVGVLLVATMTVLPATFALLWRKNTSISLVIAFFYTLISMLSGIFLSSIFDIAPGVLIVLISVIIYALAHIINNKG